MSHPQAGRGHGAKEDARFAVPGDGQAPPTDSRGPVVEGAVGVSDPAGLEDTIALCVSTETQFECYKTPTWAEEPNSSSRLLALPCKGSACGC